MRTSQRWTKAVLAVLLATAVAAPSAAQMSRSGVLGLHPGDGAAPAPRVDLEGSGSATRRGEPGSTVTLMFHAQNKGPAALALRGNVHLPPGWAAVALDTGAVALADHADELLMVAVAVPSDAAPGMHAVHYALSLGSTVLARDSILVEVAALPGLELRLLSAPMTVVAGETIEARFVATNIGNAPLDVRWRAQAQPALDLQAPGPGRPLQPGEVRAVEIRGVLPANLTKATRHRVELRGEVAGIEPTVASAVVEIVPSRGSGESTMRRFPVQVNLRAATATGGAPTVEVWGSDALSEDGRSRFSFLARRPEVSSSLTGEIEEYRVALETPTLGLSAGHRVFGLSTLTEPGRYGLGGEGRLSFGAFTAAGFVSQERRGGEGAQAGGRLALSATGSGRLEANFLRRAEGDVWSLRAMAAAGPLARAEVEYGTSTEQGLEPAHALAVRIQGSSRYFRYDVHQIQGDEGYLGGYGGILQRYAGVQVTPGARLHMGGTYSLHERLSGSAGAESDARTRNESRRASVGHADLFTLEYERGRHTSEAGTRPADRESQLARVRLGLRLKNVSLRSALERGAVTDLLTGERAGSGSLDVSVGVHSTAGHALSARIERRFGPYLFSSNASERLTGGLGLTLPLGRHTHFQFSGHAVLEAGVLDPASGVFEASIRQELPLGHVVTARARGFGTVEQGLPRTTFGSVEYSIPLGIPYRRAQRTGEVEGRVLDRETNVPVAGALVRLGEAVVATDRDGRYAFRGLKEGVHHLNVDRGSLGNGRVPILALPAPVLVEAGSVTRISVEVARGARVFGSIQVDTTSRVTASGEAIGRPVSLLLELSSGERSFRLLVSAGDSFEWRDLPPGNWTFQVIDARIPAHHEVSLENASLLLTPGEERVVELRIAPLQRPIRMLPGGEIDGRAVDGDRPRAESPPRSDRSGG